MPTPDSEISLILTISSCPSGKRRIVRCMSGTTLAMGCVAGGLLTITNGTGHPCAILRAGFTKILIVNGHGGNVAALSALTTDLAQELKTPIGVTTLYSLPHEANAFAPILEDQKGVEHACEAETSMMLAAFPDNVRRNKIHEAVGGRGEQAPVRRALQIWKSFTSMTPTGVIGDARKSTAEKGEKLLDIAADLLAERLLKGEPWA